jgi:hypothetical protein
MYRFNLFNLFNLFNVSTFQRFNHSTPQPMLTQLLTVKGRLGIDEFEVKDDVLLTNAIQAVTDRFDKECGRTLARTVDAQQEFSADETELRVACYPIEVVTQLIEGKRIELGALQASILVQTVRISLATRLGAGASRAGDLHGRLCAAGGPGWSGQVLPRPGTISADR